MEVKFAWRWVIDDAKVLSDASGARKAYQAPNRHAIASECVKAGSVFASGRMPGIAS